MTITMQIDERIVNDFVAGDIDAFKTVYETTRQMMYGVIYKMTGNTHDAEDLLHDIYVKAYEKRALYKRSKSALHTWIYTIAVNHTLNTLKKKQRWNSDSIIADDSLRIDDFTERLANQSDWNLVQLILEKINPDYKTCIILKDVEEKSYEEIAGILDISIGTVRSRIHRGRKCLQNLFLMHERRQANEV